MDHFTSSRGYCQHRCDHFDCSPAYSRMSYCMGGCGKLRPEWKQSWCKACRKTDKYAEHLAAKEAWKVKTAGMSNLDILAMTMKEVYSPKYYKALEDAK